MQKIVLKASARSITGKKVRSIRHDGMLPAVLYGHGLQSQAISLNAHDFDRVFEEAGHNTILDLKVDDKSDLNVLIHDVARDSVSDRLIHADLYRVKMDEEIRTSVPLHFVGESTAVFQENGSLLTNIEEIEIETLPAYLPANIEVDISVLDDFEKTITVGDLNIPDKVKVLNDLEELVVKVDPPRSDEELAELEEPISEEDDVPESVREGDEAEGDGSDAEANQDSDDSGDKE